MEAMDPASLMRELRGGPSSATRTGLFSLVLGAAVALLVVVLLTPAVDGLVGLPGHALTKDAPLVRPRAIPLTPAQRAAARRTAVLVAAREVGVREYRGSNNSARIITFRRAVTGRGEDPRSAEPWCADFVSWAWKRAGAPLGFEGRGSDYVPELVAWARLTRRWHWARDGYRPAAGDLVVFRTAAARRGHVELVGRVSPGRIHTIEGNYADRVSRRVLKPWDDAVTGFIAPV